MGEISWGRNVLEAKRPGGAMSSQWAKSPGDETSKGRNVHNPITVSIHTAGRMHSISESMYTAKLGTIFYLLI